MDVMALRRMMAQMAQSGKPFISGTITIPSSGSTISIDFGRTSNKYLIIFEADEASKTLILNSGEAEPKTFSLLGRYPAPTLGDILLSNYVQAYRIVPSTGVISTSNTTVPTLTNTSFTTRIAALTSSNANFFYYGLTYEYTVVFID